MSNKCYGSGCLLRESCRLFLDYKDEDTAVLISEEYEADALPISCPNHHPTKINPTVHDVALTCFGCKEQFSPDALQEMMGRPWCKECGLDHAESVLKTMRK